MTENMKLWDAVSKTNPANTRHVSQRGGFTSINAHSQIMEATAQFGPIGVGWGYVAGQPYFHDNLMFVPVTLWHGDRGNTFGPWHGCEEWRDKNGRIDSDVSKKAMTDAITKGLSHIGFNADVFLGKYDDQKYVDNLKEEFADKIEYITDDQRTELQAMIEGYGLNIIDVCRAGKIDSLKDIHATNFEKTKAWLNRQHDKKRKDAA